MAGTRTPPNPAETTQITAFRARLRLHMARQGVSQDSLADASGCSKAYMCMILKGEREPALRLALAIARTLGVTLADMTVAAACAACGDLPPEGFKCLACGAEGTQP